MTFIFALMLQVPPSTIDEDSISTPFPSLTRPEVDENSVEYPVLAPRPIVATLISGSGDIGIDF